MHIMCTVNRLQRVQIKSMISFVYIILQMAPPEVGQLIMKIMPKLVSTANKRARACSNEGVEHSYHTVVLNQ